MILYIRDLYLRLINWDSLPDVMLMLLRDNGDCTWTAVFRIPAKGARKVEVDLWGVGKYELIPETGDASTSEFWVGGVTGIEPGFHYYTCQVNGTTVVNPVHRLVMGVFGL